VMHALTNALVAQHTCVNDQVVAHCLRAAAHPIGQLDVEGVGIREVADFHGAGAASKSLDEGVAVQSGLP
jgi:hypothetical protein